MSVTMIWDKINARNELLDEVAKKICDLPMKEYENPYHGECRILGHLDAVDVIKSFKAPVSEIKNKTAPDARNELVDAIKEKMIACLETGCNAPFTGEEYWLASEVKSVLDSFKKPKPTISAIDKALSSVRAEQDRCRADVGRSRERLIQTTVICIKEMAHHIKEMECQGKRP